jgi:D-glycero-D-manno-heptose 1,7-bisphosphate phosphatase
MNRTIDNSLALILLDRDGVINVDSPDYIRSAEQWQPLPGAIDAIVLLQKYYAVAVCTNQSGVGRGLFDESTLHKMHSKMNGLICAAGGTAVDVFFCPHTPQQGCECRKPKTGLLTAAMSGRAHPVSKTLYVGDSEKDLLAAQAAHCRAALVLTGKGQKTLLTTTGQRTQLIAADLLALAKKLTATTLDV